ncbi:hypothetical protein L1049_018227 [Liquidambar formosana]|uniref:Protein PAF1 homolog n=1 Tax=Liquidambar formosana TaxID=63359 RepID=A0AAP0R9S5_LIQFO
MASFGPYPPQSSFGPPPNQNPHPPPPPLPHPPPQQRGNQFSQNWAYNGGDGSMPPAPPPNYNQMHPNSSFHHGGYGSSTQHYGSSRPQHPPPPPPHHLHHQPPPQQQQQQYSYPPPPPPPPESSYPPPPPPSMPQSALNLQPQPPPAPMYYPPSQFSQFGQQPPLPPPPPSSPPPFSSIPPPPPPPSHPLSPPPPPSAVPPLHQSKDSGPDGGVHKNDRGRAKEFTSSGRHESGHLNQGHPPKQQKPPVPPVPVKKSNGLSGRVETEEERRLRKKRELEKQRQEEKHRHQLKESQNTVLQKTQLLSSGNKGHGSIVGSRMGERRSTPFLSGERIENRLKKPTTFLCKMKFRNELPDPSAQLKLMSLKKDKDQYTKYTITSLEKNHKPELYVEPDLGIPLDLLDLSVYNPPSEIPPLAPEDEELLRDDEEVTPVKKDGIRRKERPTDKGVSWLVKTQYISPLSNEAAKQSLTEKQAKELRERKGGRNILENFNNRERKIQEIEASFEACKSRPVHATNSKLEPVEILPLFPDFDRYEDQFVLAAFDSAPTADSEPFSKMDKSLRDVHESRAIMKSFVAKGSDTAKPEKFLAYMVPSPDELSKDMYDEQEEISYSWVREYHWDVRGEDADDPTTYFVVFDDGEARYSPLPTKLVLRKKRAKEGRSNDEAEHFPIPSEVTVRRRSTVSATELKDVGVYSSSKGSKRGGLDIEDGFERSHKVARDQDMDQYSGAEDEMSE